LPNTIAQVLSDHTLAVHNALDITELGTVSSGIWQGTAIANAYIAGINQNLLTTSNVTFINISGNRFIQVASGIPSSNLGAPTVTEMALFDPQFENKTEFYDISNLKFYIYDAGWDEYTDPTDANKRKFLGGDASSGIFIPNLAEKFRIEITNSGPYVFLNALYMYWSSNSHNTTVHIWKRKYSTQVWSQVTSSATTVSAWPGHMYLPFSTIPFHPTSDTHYDAIRIEFTPNWSGDPVYGDRDISLYRLQLWGGYPAGKRRLYSIDEYKKATFPGDVVVPKLIIGSYYLNSLIANNKVPDSDKVDGEHASAIVTKARVDAIGADHAQLSNVLSGQHHAQLHGSSHHSGGGDAVKLDDLASPDDNVDLNASITKHGLLKKLGGGTVNFLRADGAWATPAGGAPHASEHEVGGGDLVSHDSLTDFVGAEHLSLPNTIANVLSDHTLTVHNALNITQLGTISSGIWQGTAIGWTYISKTGSNLTDLATRQHAGLSDAPADAHHPQSHTLASHTSKDHHLLAGLGDDDHSIYYNAARHTKAIHDSLAIDHGSLGGRGDDDHSQYYNSGRHTKAVHDALLITILGSGALAKDHGTPATDMLVNVCYGTGAPPTANLTTIGTIFIRYTA